MASRSVPILLALFGISSGLYNSVGKIMLIGGNPSNKVEDAYSSEVAVWDLQSPNTVCTDIASYPQGIVQGQAAFVYKDRVMACGGFLDNFSNLRECFAYDAASNAWSFAEVMIAPTAVARMAAVEVRGDWWLIGGDEQGDAVDSTQIWKGSLFRFEEGPSLPARITSACAVNVDDDKVYFIGGRADDDSPPYLKSAYVYDVSENLNGLSGEWSPIDDLPMAIRSPSCALVDGMYGREIIVAGGRKEGGYISDTVMVYNLDSGKWRTLDEKLPYRVSFASTVQNPTDLSGFLVLGGQQFNTRGDGVYELTDKVLDFDASDYTWKERPDLVLPWGPRSWMMTAYLPDDYITC